MFPKVWKINPLSDSDRDLIQSLGRYPYFVDRDRKKIMYAALIVLLEKYFDEKGLVQTTSGLVRFIPPSEAIQTLVELELISAGLTNGTKAVRWRMVFDLIDFRHIVTLGVVAIATLIISYFLGFGKHVIEIFKR